MAAQHPPSLLANFKVNARALEARGFNGAVSFELRCAACGTDSFRLIGFPTVAPNPSPYYEVAPGETILLPPHKLECFGCKSTKPLFDPRTQGYDGVLNGGCAYECGSGIEGDAGPASAILVTVSYSIDVQELEQLALEAGVPAVDLFDALTIATVHPEPASCVELEYECA